MKHLLATILFAAIVAAFVGCTPKADTSRGPEQPPPKDGPGKADVPVPPPPPPPPKK